MNSQKSQHSLRGAGFCVVDAASIPNTQYPIPNTQQPIAKMNKSELIEAAATRAGTTKKQTDAIVSAVLDAITQAVADREKVMLVGFGTFESRQRQARDGRNPKTGETMQIPATVVPAFSAGKVFKEAVNK